MRDVRFERLEGRDQAREEADVVAALAADLDQRHAQRRALLGVEVRIVDRHDGRVHAVPAEGAAQLAHDGLGAAAANGLDDMRDADARRRIAARVRVAGGRP